MSQTRTYPRGWRLEVIRWGVGLAAAGVAAILIRLFFPGVVDALYDFWWPNQVVLGTGDVQVTLRWTGAADLDLYVNAPDGQQIWYKSPSSPGGGKMDLDANAGCQERLVSPVENIFWPEGMAPRGEYHAGVLFSEDCDGSGVAAFELTVTVDDTTLDVINGHITAAEGTRNLRTFRY